ncbi:MAG: aldehyde ferredoxin oxidoreductase family protein [Deltaproteobacteria bacterium]|jgi:aldehyde:ferredoxin oxidoreductase
MDGWVGKILRVNLTGGAVSEEPLDPGLAERYIGARGLGVRYLFSEVDAKVDPLGPDNRLIFASGPLSGTFAPSSGRYNVITKGPLAGAVAVSNSGGMFGPQLKYAGYDMVIVEGKAGKPVYLWIEDGHAELRDAAHVWGKGVADTTDMIREETDEEASIACIGPAGEQQVLLACVINEMYRAAGGGGTGAVMGSKNLKALAVFGSGGVNAAERSELRKAVLDARAKIQAHPVGGRALKAYGSAMLIRMLNRAGGLPTRNFRDTSFSGADHIDGEALTANILVRPKGCYSCIMACGRVTRVVQPGHEGFGEGPEFGTAWALGADCGIGDLNAVARANTICAEQGLDTVGTGATIACAMDLFENGLLTLEDTQGTDLRFGNGEGLVEMVRKTAAMEGFGKKLAQGSFRLAQACGHPEYSMTVRKQEMPGFDPRAIEGAGLNCATSNRGGGQAVAYISAAELLGDASKGVRRNSEGTARRIIDLQNLVAALDSSGSCLFCLFGIGAEELVRMLTSVTGVPFSVEKFMEAGERIYTLERVWNLRAGFSGKDDTLPERVLKHPGKKETSKAEPFRLEETLPEYYRLRGWDAEGVPTRSKLDELGLAPDF